MMHFNASPLEEEDVKDEFNMRYERDKGRVDQSVCARVDIVIMRLSNQTTVLKRVKGFLSSECEIDHNQSGFSGSGLSNFTLHTTAYRSDRLGERLCILRLSRLRQQCTGSAC